MKGIKRTIAIDKLTVCCKGIDEVLTQLSNGDFFDFREFTLERIMDKGYKDAFIIKIQELDNENGGVKWIHYANLKFNKKISDGNFSNLVWIYFENKSLYTAISPKQNIIVYVNFIIETLNLQLNNITNLELALDTNINIAKKIKKLILNPQLIPIIIGKKILDKKERIQRLELIYNTNRTRASFSSIYIRQAKSNGLVLNCYDKNKEITEKKAKEYIREYQGMGKNFFRAEVRIRSENLKTFFKSKNIDTNELLYTYLNDSIFLESMYEHFSNRLIRFSYKSRTFSILDICS